MAAHWTCHFSFIFPLLKILQPFLKYPRLIFLVFIPPQSSKAFLIQDMSQKSQWFWTRSFNICLESFLIITWILLIKQRSVSNCFSSEVIFLGRDCLRGWSERESGFHSTSFYFLRMTWACPLDLIKSFSILHVYILFFMISFYLHIVGIIWKLLFGFTCFLEYECSW